MKFFLIKHQSKMQIKQMDQSIKSSNSTLFLNSEIPCEVAQEEVEEEIPDEISRLLKHEERIILPHKGSFGTHSNGHAMSRKILRAGYYWITMESDCCKHVKRCHKC